MKRQARETITSLLLRTKFDRKQKELIKRLETFSLRDGFSRLTQLNFYPGHVLGILTDLEKSIRESDLQQINLLLQQLGKTGFINKDKPTPYDEALSFVLVSRKCFFTMQFQKSFNLLVQTCKIPLTEWKNDRLIVIGFLARWRSGWKSLCKE
jgi:phosphoenolpyruvate carboxylase